LKVEKLKIFENLVPFPQGFTGENLSHKGYTLKMQKSKVGTIRKTGDLGNLVLKVERI
jgi:hypothetical protein